MRVKDLNQRTDRVIISSNGKHVSACTASYPSIPAKSSKIAFGQHSVRPNADFHFKKTMLRFCALAVTLPGQRRAIYYSTSIKQMSSTLENRATLHSRFDSKRSIVRASSWSLQLTSRMTISSRNFVASVARMTHESPEMSIWHEC